MNEDKITRIADAIVRGIRPNAALSTSKNLSFGLKQAKK